MIIGFDGSRSFVKNKTGTEHYAYQLLKHLAKIDQKNQYIIYLRPGNVVEEYKVFDHLVYIGHPRESEDLFSEENLPNRSSIRSRMTSEEILDARRQTLTANYGWPENFQFKLLNYPRLWTQLGLAKQTFTDKLDVLFVPSHTLPLIRKPGLKTVMTIHDLGSEYLPGMHQLKQRLYLRLMTKIQLKTASKLIAVSEATKKDLISKVGIEKKNIEVVYEGVNDHADLPRSNSKSYKDVDKKIIDIEKKDQIDINDIKIEKNRYFLFVGTIQPRKNLVRLIKAYAGFLNVESNQLSESANQRSSESVNQRIGESGKNDDFKKISPLVRQSAHWLPKLVLAGGKGWLSAEIFALPKKLGIEEHVVFTGRVSDKDLNTLYKNALAFTFPSLFEGFGLPVLEAFDAEIPVITSNNSSLPEVAGDAALLVDPSSTEQILESLLTIYNDKSLRVNLVKKGIEQLKKFSWEKCAKETLAVLEQTVEN